MIFNQYPYLNLNDLNLDYIMKAIKEMRYEVTNYVSINAIKYADPIQWNITSQYEKNTIVIDPVTGTAYISVAPVPAGVALTRPEYWTVVFDLGSFVTRAAQNFTSHWESDTTTTATFNSNAGDWLVWGDVLYKALVNITAGDTYVVNSNIEHFTIEDLYNAYLNTIASILNMVGDLDTLDTTDKTNIVSAINEVVSNIGDLNDLNTESHTSVVSAINEVVSNIGDLNDLNTESHTSVVSAINEVIERSETVQFYFPPNNDGPTRDSTMLMVVNKRGYLFDTGYSYNRNLIITYYQSLFTAGIVENIDKIFISHYHADHYSLLPDILASLPHDDCIVYLPMNFDGYYSGTEYSALLNDRNTVINTLTSYNVPYIEVNSVTDIALENDVSIKLLNSTPNAYNYYKTDGTNYYNNYSMFSLISVGDNHIYFLADIQGIAEQYAVNNYDLPRAYLCVINHHAQQWDDIVSFMNALSPFNGVFQTNTNNLEVGGVFASYNVDHLYTTANGAVEAYINKSGGIINGIEVARKGITFTVLKFYVDNSYSGISNGDPEHPFKNITEALQFIPRERVNNEINIYIKGTITPYDTIVARQHVNSITFRDWGTSPTIRGFYIEHCYSVSLVNMTFAGVQQHDTSFNYLGVVRYSQAVINSCTLQSDSSSRINGISTLMGDIIFQNCTFTSLTQPYDTTLWAKVFAVNSTFNNVGFCYSMASTELTIRNVDTIDVNTDYYLRASATTLMTPCNIILPNTADLNAFKALCAKNTADVISNYFKHGDTILSIVGTEVIRSKPIPVEESLSDLNDINYSGFYYGTGSSANRPTGVSSGGSVLSFKADAINKTQIFIPNNNDTIYIRQQRAGTWSAWKSLTPT